MSLNTDSFRSIEEDVMLNLTLCMIEARFLGFSQV